MTYRKHLIAATLLCAAIAAPASAQMRSLADPVVPHPDPESLFTSADPVLHRNKQTALHIQRNLLTCGQWDRTREWLTDRYIQHNPVAASGLDGLLAFFSQMMPEAPQGECAPLSADAPNGVVAVMAEGDYVTILSRRIVPYEDDPSQTYTTTWYDTWRFVDGKADEHWDPTTLTALDLGPPPAQ